MLMPHGWQEMVGFLDTLEVRMTDRDSFDLEAELRKLRLGYADFAHQCGVSRITVWKWRQGRAPVPI